MKHRYDIIDCVSNEDFALFLGDLAISALQGDAEAHRVIRWMLVEAGQIEGSDWADSSDFKEALIGWSYLRDEGKPSEFLDLCRDTPTELQYEELAKFGAAANDDHIDEEAQHGCF